MDSEKLIVALLLIAIVLSVITLAITMTAEVVVNPKLPPSETTNTASVVLDIVKNPAKSGAS